MKSPDEQELKRLFQRQRELDAAHAPPFSRVARRLGLLSEEDRRLFRRLKLGLATGFGVGALIAIVSLTTPAPRQSLSSGIADAPLDRAALASVELRETLALGHAILLSRWEAPSDVLLRRGPLADATPVPAGPESN